MQAHTAGGPRGHDDAGAPVRHGQREPAGGAAPVERDHAGAAWPVAAALLGTGDPAALARGVQQRRARVYRELVLRPSHPQRDGTIHWEALYGNGPPFGLAQAGEHVPATGNRETARRRLGQADQPAVETTYGDAPCQTERGLKRAGKRASW